MGNAGDDILIGGRTIYDSNYAALDKIMEEWNSGDEYPLRVDHLRGIVPGGANGFYFLNSSTVLDDGAVDRMTGSAGRDWFLGNLSQDEFSDQGKGELDN